MIIFKMNNGMCHSIKAIDCTAIDNQFQDVLE